jgi:hypothetical protein
MIYAPDRCFVGMVILTLGSKLPRFSRDCRRRSGSPHSQEPIDPEDADHPTIRGLRGTGIPARAEQGYEVDQITHTSTCGARTWTTIQGSDEGRGRWPEAAPFGQHPRRFQIEVADED